MQTQVGIVKRCTDNSIWLEHRTQWARTQCGQVWKTPTIKGPMGHAKESVLYSDNNKTIKGLPSRRMTLAY